MNETVTYYVRYKQKSTERTKEARRQCEYCESVCVSVVVPRIQRRVHVHFVLGAMFSESTNVVDDARLVSPVRQWHELQFVADVTGSNVAVLQAVANHLPTPTLMPSTSKPAEPT